MTEMWQAATAEIEILETQLQVKLASRYKYIYIQSHLVITRSSGGIFWDRGISEARYRFCRQVFFFFNLVYLF